MLGFLGVALTFLAWWRNVINEAHAGDHTPVVQLHQRYGMILFIASEVMFFVGWFWAFFDFSLFPIDLAEVIGGTWPPKGIEAVMDLFDLPLLNTLILLCSAPRSTWAHHELIHGNWEGLEQGLRDHLLGLLFPGIQAYEYMHAPFGFGENTYGSAFDMATGFHGFHVIVGTIFLAVCQARLQGPLHPSPALRLRSGGAWYWHFVDVVVVPLRRHLRGGGWARRSSDRVGDQRLWPEARRAGVDPRRPSAWCLAARRQPCGLRLRDLRQPAGRADWPLASTSRRGAGSISCCFRSTALLMAGVLALDEALRPPLGCRLAPVALVPPTVIAGACALPRRPS